MHTYIHKVNNQFSARFWINSEILASYLNDTNRMYLKRSYLSQFSCGFNPHRCTFYDIILQSFTSWWKSVNSEPILLGFGIVHDYWLDASASNFLITNLPAMSIVVLRFFCFRTGSVGRVRIAFWTVVTTFGRWTSQDASPKSPFIPSAWYLPTLV